MEFLIPTSSGKVGVDVGDNIANSIMLDSSASQYLSRTFGTPTSNTIWTWSSFGKQAILQTVSLLSASGPVGSFGINSALQAVLLGNAGTSVASSTGVLRDSTGHGHLLVNSDGTTIKVYYNNQLVLSYAGTITTLNSAVLHYIGRYGNGGQFYDGYLSQIIFVDGQALAPTGFGRYAVGSGQWVSKTYTGTYGNNGFKLEFLNGSSLGTDTSGNGNHWTLNGGITSANQFTDTPTSNHCVLDYLQTYAASTYLRSGNLKSVGANAHRIDTGTIPASFPSYWEIAFGGGAAIAGWGVALTGKSQAVNNGNASGLTNFFWIYTNTQQFFNDAASAVFGTTAFISAETWQVAIDPVSGKGWLGRNNNWYDSTGGSTGNPSAGTNPTFTFTAGASYSPIIENYSATLVCNFGQKAFTFTPPTGFKALNATNMPEGTAAAPATFVGNASADGPFIWCNGTPETATINGNAITWGTHADRTAGGIKLRTAAATHNAAGTNTLSCTFLNPNKKSVFKYQTAKGN